MALVATIPAVVVTCNTAMQQVGNPFPGNLEEGLSPGHGVAAGDLDQNGKPEIVRLIQANGYRVKINKSDGTFAAGNDYSVFDRFIDGAIYTILSELNRLHTKPHTS